MSRASLSLFTLAVVFCLSPDARADDFDGQVLETATHRITITETCEEGVVDCDEVEYTGRDKKNGASIRLSGTTHMVMCADRVTPCHIGYYEFRNGPYTYLVYPQGFLEVRRGKQVLLSEQGKWLD